MSIYSNWDIYRQSVRLVCNVDNYIFQDEIISSCVEKLNNYIDLGKIDVNNIQYRNSTDINSFFFSKMVTRKTIDELRKKSSNHVNIEYTYVTEEQEYDEVLDKLETDLIEYQKKEDALIKRKLSKYAKTNAYCNYDVTVYKYISGGMSIRKLSREADISRYALTSSYNRIKEMIKEWVKPFRKKHKYEEKSNAIKSHKQKG